MGFIEDELQNVKNHCEQIIHGSRIVSCVKSLVRVEIKCTEIKAVVVCMQFPEEYPSVPILIELKTKTLSEKFLQKLTGLVEQHIKEYIGKQQILAVLQFVGQVIIENPLCCCYDEIHEIKKRLHTNDYIKLKQKSSILYLRVTEANYFVALKLIIPDDYPIKGVRLEATTNFPSNLEKFLIGQAIETSRKCVEPPLRQTKNIPFKPVPSLLPTFEIFFAAVRNLPKESCQYCKKPGLPDVPENAVVNEMAADHIERLFCNHLFHLGCLLIYLKAPPFEGGKKCPTCGVRIYHNKWNITDKMAEERWAHQEAKRRELEDVAQAFL